tara:strand:+ start:74 stop:868 length:795 start_codon:yes stop_codon:yes gene_type:complete
MTEVARAHFISYGDHNFSASVDRIEQEAREFDAFSTVSVYKNKDFYDEDFRRRFGHIIAQPRGSGYWIWKYYLINEKMKEIQDGEFIVYCDAGCMLNSIGKARYYQYLDMLRKSEYGVLSFQLNSPEPDKLLEKKWTTRQIFEAVGVDGNGEIANSRQLVATVKIWKKCDHARLLLDEYRRVLDHDPLLITDHYNLDGQSACFVENRHDQSIWSLIRKKHGSLVLERDETYYYFQETDAQGREVRNYDLPGKFKYPFWATRIKN